MQKGHILVQLSQHIFLQNSPRVTKPLQRTGSRSTSGRVVTNDSLKVWGRNSLSFGLKQFHNYIENILVLHYSLNYLHVQKMMQL